MARLAIQKSKSAEERAANKQLNTDLISLLSRIKISISMVVGFVTKISITNFFTIFFQSGEYQLCLVIIFTNNLRVLRK